MITTDKEREDESTGAGPYVKEKPGWRDYLDKVSYKGLVKNTPYLMFLTLLCILYIANTNRAIFLIRSNTEKAKELKELRWRYLDIQSRLMYQTSETQLVPKAQKIGLKPLDKPAYEIRVGIDKSTKE